MTDRSVGGVVFVVIGDTHVARRVCASLLQRGSEVLHLVAPGDDELRKAMVREPRGVAVLLHDDVAALRYALAVAHIAPTAPLVVTIFDQTVSEQLVKLLPRCHVTSPAHLATATLVAPCLEPEALAIRRTEGRTMALHRSGEELVESPWALGRRARWHARVGRVPGQLRPHDAGTRLLLLGLAGILAVLLGDWIWLTLGAGHEPAEAFHEAARVVAAVGPATSGHAPTSYLLVSALAMLITVVLTAAFTAGVVDRLLGPRLVGLIGARALPRSGHVVVVGLGQVGLRLCRELQLLGVAVVGVERDPQAPNLRIARTLGVPVIVAHGGDRAVLERLGVHRAQALAAVGSDDLDNIAIAVAAHGVAPGTRVVMRAGEHEAIAETRSLLPLGTTRDVTSLSTTYVVARLLGTPATAVVGHDKDVYLAIRGAGFSRSPMPPREECRHGDRSESDPGRSSHCRVSAEFSLRHLCEDAGGVT
ncbi:NAD-binding protein [Nocardioides immobilis]|uniref:NAD-binding protein n=1 Tax=Nocardioides immobilis TaxID=2049295 RepID=UPI001C70BC7B|nr:NAD-binding protein [Nocardioides immobilis]